MAAFGNQYGIDLGAIDTAGNAFVDQRQRQQINALSLQNAQQQQQDRNALSAAGPQITSTDPAQREQGYKRLSDQPELVMKLRSLARSEDKERIAAVADATGRAAVGLSSLPDEQLAEHWPAAVSALEAKVGHPAIQWRQAQTPQQMRQVLDGSIADAQTVTQALAEKDKAATRQQAATTAAETARHNKADEGLRAQQLGVEANKPVQLSPGNTLVNPRTGQPTGGGLAPGGIDASNLHGDDFLKTLPPALATEVKALAEGRLPMPTGYSLAKLQPLIQQVSQYDPSFDAVDYNSRSKTRAAFAGGGKAATTINNLNTAIGHAGTLLDQIPGTAGHSGFPFATTVNAAQNSFMEGAGSPGVPLFKDTAGKLAEELTAVYRGGGGAEKDVVRALETMSPNASEETKQAILKNAVDLLDSKLGALGDQYNQGMGTTRDPLQLLNAHAKETFQKLKNVGSKAPVAASPPSRIKYDAQGNRIQ